MKFTLFKNSLAECRSYVYSCIHTELIQKSINRFRLLYPEKIFEFPSSKISDFGDEVFIVSHVTAPPRQGLISVENNFGINLPEDIKEFYKQYLPYLLSFLRVWLPFLRHQL